MLNCVDVCEPLLLAPVVLPSTVTVDLLAEIPIRAPITKLPFWMQEMSDKEVVVGVVGIVVDCADVFRPSCHECPTGAGPKPRRIFLEALGRVRFRVDGHGENEDVQMANDCGGVRRSDGRPTRGSRVLAPRQAWRERKSRTAACADPRKCECGSCPSISASHR